MELALKARFPGHLSTQRIKLHLLPWFLLITAVLVIWIIICCVARRREPDTRRVRLPSGATVTLRNN